MFDAVGMPLAYYGRGALFMFKTDLSRSVTMSPPLEDRVIHAKGKRDKEEAVIRELDESGILTRFAGRIIRKPVEKNDEVYQEARLAVYDAINRFDIERSNPPKFLAYLFQVMKSKIHNTFFRQSNRTHPIEDWMEFPAYPIDDVQNRLEWVEVINEYSQLIQTYGFTLQDLQKASPKHQDARKEQKRIAQWLIDSGYSADFLTDQCNLSEIAKALNKSKRYFQRNHIYLKGLLLLHQPQFEKMHLFLEFGKGESYHESSDS